MPMHPPYSTNKTSLRSLLGFFPDHSPPATLGERASSIPLQSFPGFTIFFNSCTVPPAQILKSECSALPGLELYVEESHSTHSLGTCFSLSTVLETPPRSCGCSSRTFPAAHSHGMNAPQLIHPFYCQWAFGLFR